MSAASNDVRLAATLIVARDDPAGPPYFLMAERSAAMSFAGGAMVFPGGAVDSEDYALAALLDLGPDMKPEADDLAARIAAVRETIEECGLALALGERALPPDKAILLREAMKSGDSFAAAMRSLEVAVAVERLIPFARWCPPRRGATRRFDTRFYLTVTDEAHDDLLPDGGETVALGWYRARDVLDRADAGEAKIIFPTRRNLERLAQFESVDALMKHIRAHPPALVSPWVEERDGIPHLCIPEGIGYPVTSEPLTTARRG